MKAISIMSNSSKVIVGLAIFILFTIGLSSIILILAYMGAVKYTFFNRIECAERDICKNDPTYYPIPDQLTISYSQETAQFALDLVNRVQYDIGKDSVENCTKLIELYNSMDRSISCGVIWKSSLNEQKIIDTNYKNIIWIAIRGTDNSSEWFNNFRISQVSYKDAKRKYSNIPTFMRDNKEIKVHSGFMNLYNQIYPDIIKTLLEYDKNEIQICLAGHSLGGAVSSILGRELVHLGFSCVLVYTFGSPRVGNFTFTNTFQDQNNLTVYRIANTEDVSTEMPTSVSPNIFNFKEPNFYLHCGSERTFTENWKSLANNHSISIYTEGLKRIFV
jgi:hypothetical protein